MAECREKEVDSVEPVKWLLRNAVPAGVALYKAYAAYQKWQTTGDVGDGVDVIENVRELPDTVKKLFQSDDLDAEEQIAKALKDALDGILYGTDFDFPEDAREILRSGLTMDTVLDFLSAPAGVACLKSEVRSLLLRDPDFDEEYFQMDKFVGQLRNVFTHCLRKNPNLVALATYETTRANQGILTEILDKVNQLSEPATSAKTEESKPKRTKVEQVNKLYADSFEKPLFLHDEEEDTPVKLKNLYVLPKHEPTRRCEDGTELDLLDEVKEFIHSGDRRMLILEGDAGCGKTTFIGKLNYLRVEKPDQYTDIFAKRPVVTVRLRDLQKEQLEQEYGLAQAIADHMGLGKVGDDSWTSPKVILLLDGFDELCMIERFRKSQSAMLYELSTQFRHSRIIITTRPQYIDENIDVLNIRLHLTHFDEGQRDEWLRKYTGACKQTVAPKVRTYIENVKDNAPSCICDSPIVLYMLAATPDSDMYLDNAWSLYNHIFYNALSNTEYNNRPHEIKKYRDAVYQVSEEIAYWMYQRGNSAFSVDSRELETIILDLSKRENLAELLDTDTARKMTEKNYALCCYWKSGKDKGAVEFLHNNIRDFFLAEKLYRDMNTLYKGEPDPEKIASRLAQLLPYGELEEQVVNFLHLRALAKKGQDDDFAQQDRLLCMNHKVHMSAKVMTALSGDAIFNRDTFGPNEQLREWEVNGYWRMVHIVKNTAYLYQAAFEAHMNPDNKDDHIFWLEEESRNYSLFCSLASEILRMGWFRGIAPGYHADLQGANLWRTDLRGADLRGADLRGAHVQDTVLRSAKLLCVDLRDSDLRDSDLVAVDLRGSDLRGAIFQHADLRKAWLPDGFRSFDQKEQIAHLKSLHIPGLKI